MKMKSISLALTLAPLAFSTVVMAEKGVVYDAGNMGWRTGYGECWITHYRDRDPAPTGCFDTPLAEGDADGDADGDTVVDSRDQCPGTPAGAMVDTMGCELDSDADGMVDSRDECPNTPDGATVDNRGCALRIVLMGVRFKLNKDELTVQSKAILDSVAGSLIERRDVTSLMVVGHTDSTGEADYNQSLSEKRAESVMAYLVSQGVESGVLSSKGMGESVPIADNATAEGRKKNRRVELKLD
jgi:OOP family OmpA-OmpF porin